jgi:hypothetical protein
MGGGVSGCMVVAHNKTYVANDNGEQEWDANDGNDAWEVALICVCAELCRWWTILFYAYALGLSLCWTMSMVNDSMLWNVDLKCIFMCVCVMILQGFKFICCWYVCGDHTYLKLSRCLLHRYPIFTSSRKTNTKMHMWCKIYILVMYNFLHRVFLCPVMAFWGRMQNGAPKTWNLKGM